MACNDRQNAPRSATPGCAACTFEPFVHNNFFDGKLMVADDFIAETAYHAEKLRHHNTRLHGHGVVCGLAVKEHPDAACQPRYVIVEPGAALDCCGHEIVVTEPEMVDLSAIDAVRQLANEGDEVMHTLGVCIRFRECPTEPVPVLYDECGCDETRCAPNRILESFEFDVVVDPPLDELRQLGPGDIWGLVAASRAKPGVSLVDDDTAFTICPLDPKKVLKIDPVKGRATSIALAAQGLSIARSPDGTRLFVATQAPGGTSSVDRWLYVFDAATGSALGTGAAVTGTGGSDVYLFTSGTAPDVLLMVVAASGRVIGWPALASAANGLGPGHDAGTFGAAIRSVGLAPDGKRFFAVDGSEKIRVLDATSGTVSSVNALAAPTKADVIVPFSRLNKTMLAIGASADKSFHLVDADAATQVATVALDQPAVTMATPGGNWVHVVEESPAGVFVQTIDLSPLTAARPARVAKARKVASQGGCAIIGFGAQGSAGILQVQGVTEDRCDELLWQQLDGCGECDAPDCVTLATVRYYRSGARVESPATPPVDTATDIDNRVARIDNKVRRIVASTSTLQKWIECLVLDGGKGEKGDPGDPGAPGKGIDDAIGLQGTPAAAAILENTPSTGKRRLQITIPPGQAGHDGKGIDDAIGLQGTPAAAAILENTPSTGKRRLQITIPPGENGKDGDGLEAGLTRINALSWLHRRHSPLVPITFLDMSGGGASRLSRRASERVTKKSGIVIAFTREVFVVQPHEIDDHVFQVIVDRSTKQDADWGLWCRCNVRGRVVPVAPRYDPSGELIVSADEIAEPVAKAIAFIVPDSIIDRIKEQRIGTDLWVTLHGDFVMDAKKNREDKWVPGRAIDAEYVRADLPTGDRPKGSDVGVQGGTFHSWLSVVID